jgi:Thymidylate kinase
MLKIYFTASTSFDGKLKEEYKKIISQIKKRRHILLSGEQIINPKLLEKDANIPKEKLFQREKELIEKADCVVAEVSQPSLGVGGEIVYALVKEKPVLALLLESYENKISPMIAGNPSDNLFLEIYNLDRLSYILSDFFHHIEILKKQKGKLIIIEGGDGSGKATQAQLLVSYLKKKKILVKYFDFPQYYQTFHGQTVARYLRGEFGTLDNISPYLASLAYALDRLSAKEQMEDFLKKGGVIIANRYTPSNMAYQGARFSNEKEQEKFFQWLYELEYKINKIPKENLVIYLHVPWEIGVELTAKKVDRQYLLGKEDIHEKNIDFRKKVEQMYLHLSKTKKNWVVLNCVENGKILPKEVIHQKVIQILVDKKNIPLL